MYKCKYDFVVESAIVLIIVPDTMVVAIGIVFTIIAWIKNQLDISIVPWPVYAVVGGILLVMHVAHLIIYLFSKKICQYDEENIIFSNKGEIKKIQKSQIKKIKCDKPSIFLVILACEVYGSVQIYCNEKAEYDIIRFKVFLRMIKRLKKMGYPVEWNKKA